MSVSDNEFTPISPADMPDAALPSGSMFTKHVTQAHLKECERALGRHVLAHEVKALDEIMHAQHCANHRLARRGKLNGNHTMDEIVGVFVERVQRYDAQKLAEKIMKQTGEG